MAQAGFTPIQLYYSNTSTNVPASLANGELAINQADGKLFYRNSSGVVTQFNPAITAVNTISFGSTGLTPSTATSGAVTVAGTLGSGYGGTGFSTYATGDLIYASGVNTLSKLTAGTNGYVLTLAGGVPTWAASTGGVTSFSAGSTGLTPSTGTTGAITLAGTLGADYGGTGFASYTIGDLLYASSTTALSKLAAGTNGYILTSNGPGTAPSWQAAGTITAVTSISFGSTGLTPSTATTGVVSVAGTLGAGFGGTGISTYAVGDITYASATTPTISKLSIGTAYQILGVNSGATAPSWQGLSSLIDNVFTASAQGTILYRDASTWAALAPGTAGYVLSTGGAAANPSWIAAGGGTTGYTFALNTAAPNATNNVSSLTASGGTTNQFAAIIPKGTGGVLAAIPDSAATGGNIRGTYSVDLQLQRTAAAQVASAQGSVLIGGGNSTAGGQDSAVFAGNTNTANGIRSVVIGGSNNTVANTGSVAIGGNQATDRNVSGTVVYGAVGSTSSGSNQNRMMVLTNSTTDATSTKLTTDASAAGVNNQLVLVDASAVTFRAQIIGTVKTGAGNMKAWTIVGAIKRGTGVGTTALVGTPAVNIDAADTGASTWTATATADTTNGALSINVVGQAATNIRWTCTIVATEAIAA